MKDRVIKKRWKNSSGDIEVRETDSCGIVEIMHYWDKNKSGCVIGCWRKTEIDGIPTTQFESIYDRLMTTKYDNPQILLEALQFGQKLAEILIDQND